jgi:hypothetical protein
VTEPQKKSYDLATELAKQVLTLASAVLVFAATSLRDAVGTSNVGRGLILGSYVALFTSIAFGFRVLTILTVVLADVKGNDDDAIPVVTKIPALIGCASWQKRFFGAGVALLGLFGFLRLLP